MSPGPAQLVSTLRRLADVCASLGSPLYGGLLTRVADDVASGGPCSVVLAGQAATDQAAVGLRLLGAVHRLVLKGEAPGLVPYYPSVGGAADPAAAWPRLVELVEARGADIRALLDQPPQTNEVGRASALLGGLLHVAARTARSVRLVEIGASGGLNLRADRFRYRAADRTEWGPTDSPVVLDPAWRGSRPPTHTPLEVVGRHGSDPAPVDPGTAEGRLTLASYVWADQPARLARLRGAIAVAAQTPAVVVRASALETVSELEPVDGVATVLWHSVMWQYLGSEEQAAVEWRIEELGAGATRDAPFAHLLLEPRRRSPDADPEFVVALICWPGGEEQVLGTAAAHGLPTTWW